jgi:hypothetical protein
MPRDKEDNPGKTTPKALPSMYRSFLLPTTAAGGKGEGHALSLSEHE